MYHHPLVDFAANCGQGKYEETIKECTKALELNPNYMKALLRRAEAREKLEQYEESIAGKFQDFQNYCNIVKDNLLLLPFDFCCELLVSAVPLNSLSVPYPTP